MKTFVSVTREAKGEGGFKLRHCIGHRVTASSGFNNVHVMTHELVDQTKKG